eukprot:XP_011680396.1 PREDICTED: protocadherin Fat 4-like [Strongylocentrotus purpuratus]
MDDVICPHVDLTCPSLRNSSGDVIPLVLKYMTKQDGGMLKSSLSKDRITVNLQCTLSACLSSPCMNRGQCKESLIGFACDCKEDYVGDICQLKRPMCQNNTCSNGGTCHDDPTIGFYCLCDPCFFGEFCEQEYDIYTFSDEDTSSTYFSDFRPVELNVTVLDTFYLGVSQLVNSTSCELRKSEAAIMWYITTPNGTVPTITIYEVDTFDSDSDSEEIFIVAHSDIHERNFVTQTAFVSLITFLSRTMYVNILVPGVRADPLRQNVLLIAQGNLRSVLPYTVRALTNNMFCQFISSLRVINLERYTTVMAKVRAVYPDQL